MPIDTSRPNPNFVWGVPAIANLLNRTPKQIYPLVEQGRIAGVTKINGAIAVMCRRYWLLTARLMMTRSLPPRLRLLLRLGPHKCNRLCLRTEAAQMESHQGNINRNVSFALTRSVSSSLRASQSKATTAIGSLPASIKDDTHAAVAPPHGRDEGDDDYEHVVLVLDATCRVISECQWIVQKRRGHRWKSVSFCRTQAALIERSGATGAALAVLEGLPEWHEVAP